MHYNNAVKYKATKIYDAKLMNKGFAWHRVIIPHKGHLKKPQILAAIFDVIKGEEFFPIAYKVSCELSMLNGVF